VTEEQEDWRLSNGGDFLNDLAFSKQAYTRYREDWDHDHCELCFAEFVEPPSVEEGVLFKGYCTNDRYRWVCEGCFNDFKTHYRWQIAA
jgi:hypothetical protein